MKKLKALYIEDQLDNIEIYGDYFRNNDFEVRTIQPLPKNIDEYYKYILKEEIDFVIIDNELKKQVTYTGLEVLKEIRKQDNNIFIVLLTSFDYYEYVNALGEEIKINNEIDKEILRLSEKLNNN